MVLSLAGATASPREQASAVPVVAHLSSKAASKLVIHRILPEYPPVARINYIQGRVRLVILVNRKGSVARIHILEGQPILAAAAFKAVRKWLYRPLDSSNAAEPFVTDVSVNFSLHFQKIAHLPDDAEKFLSRQVHPPEVMARPQEDFRAAHVPLKVLVDADGKVLDSMPLGSANASIETPRWNLRCWTFRPAHWGTLAIPWYLRIEVPVGEILIQRAGSDSTGP